MNEPIQLAPLLAIYEDDGDVTVRVGAGELAKRLSISIVSLLNDTGARRLTFITPMDTKVFKLNGSGGVNVSQGNGQASQTQAQATAAVHQHGLDNGLDAGQRKPSVDRPPLPQSPARRISQDPAAPPSPELADEAMAEYERQVAEQRELEAQQRVLAADATPADTPPPEAVEPPSLSRKRQPRPEPVNSTCGRCHGAGTNEAGGTCPVCKGTGAVQAWGRARARGRG